MNRLILTLSLITLFKEGSTRWRFNNYHNDTQLNEMSTWTPIPRNQIIMDLNYMGEIVWDQP